MVDTAGPIWYDYQKVRGIGYVAIRLCSHYYWPGLLLTLAAFAANAKGRPFRSYGCKDIYEQETLHHEQLCARFLVFERGCLLR